MANGKPQFADRGIKNKRQHYGVHSNPNTNLNNNPNLIIYFEIVTNARELVQSSHLCIINATYHNMQIL